MKEHKFRTVADFLALTPEEFTRMLPDFLLWFEFCKTVDLVDGVEMKGFNWIDDGRPGELHSVQMLIKETGETELIEGPAFGPTEPAPARR